MRSSLGFLCMSVALFAAPARAQTVLSPEEAASHVGEQAVVVGLVSQVSVRPNGVIFLNFGARYPNHVFTAQIFKDVVVPGAAEMEGKRVRMSGTITTYAGKPQMVIQAADRITVESSPLAPPKPLITPQQISKPAAAPSQAPAPATVSPAAASKFSGPLAGLTPGKHRDG